ncbi:cell surface protein [Myxococcus hansupus]|uniref:Cell surface protein n=1 Tax=Pseudomyxococcus hansupus TaxID=1297742 RepID=A0A0H4X5J8_9BACT|nr:cell surface protein [Myxococcus hansupus]
MLGGAGMWMGCGGGSTDPLPGEAPCTDTPSGDCVAPPPETPDGETPPGGESPSIPPPPPRPPPPPSGPGSTVWYQREGTPQDDLALGAAVDANGDILTLSLHDLDDLGAIQPTDDRAKLVLTRRAPTGETRWQKLFDVRAAEAPPELRAFVKGRIAADPAGGIVLAGTAEGIMDFLTHKLGDGTFVVRMDADGNVLWANLVGGADLAVADLAVDPQGRTLVAFNAPGGTDFGNGVSGSGAVVVTYSREGVAEAAVPVGQPQSGGRVELTSLAVDGAGRMAVGGRYEGSVRFGGQQVGSAQEGSPFVALFNQGALTWTKAMGQAQGTVRDVGLDGAGTVVATGPFLGAVRWGDTQVQGHAFRETPFVVSAKAEGEETWAKGLGDGLQVDSLVLDSAGDMVLAGFTYNRIENGVTGQDGMGSAQPVALRYDAAGDWLHTQMYLSDPPQPRGELYGLEAIPFLGLLPDGDVILFGHTDRETDFGTGRQSSSRGDVFVLRMKR